jgi:hypothetical protein
VADVLSFGMLTNKAHQGRVARTASVSLSIWALDIMAGAHVVAFTLLAFQETFWSVAVVNCVAKLEIAGALNGVVVVFLDLQCGAKHGWVAVEENLLALAIRVIE